MLFKFNEEVYFPEILYDCHSTDRYIYAIHFNPVPSTIPKWWTLELLRWMQNLHQSKWNHIISMDEELLITPLLWRNKYEHGGRLNVKVHGLFPGDSS
jgi:hypothetical protein